MRDSALMLALTTSRPIINHARLHRGDRLIWVLLPVEFFDLCRLEESHVITAAALRASGAPLPVLTYAATAALLADAAPPPVLALLPFHCVLTFYSRFERALTFVLRTGGVPRRDPRRAHVR